MSVQHQLANTMRINNTVAKDVTRQIVTKVFEAFAENKSEVSVYSLPGKSWEFEKNVLVNHYVNNRTKTKLFCSENNFDHFIENWDIGYDVLKNFINHRYFPNYNNYKYNNNNIIQVALTPCSEHIINGIFFDYREQDIKTLICDNSFAWYDFCGNPSVERLNKINLTIKNSVQIFTFATGWRCDDNVEPNIREAGKYISDPSEAIINYFKNKIEGSEYKIVFHLEYVSSRIPMILIAISNDENVINKTFFSSDIKIAKENKTLRIKVDKAPIYAALKSGMSTEQIVQKLNVSSGTVAACKAWITMGK